MGRREQRAEMQSTWMVLEARVPGMPMRRKDMVDAASAFDAERAAARNVVTIGAPRDGWTPTVSVRTYLPALARVAVEERHKSTMRE